jgi:hypothetical protein
MEVPMTEAEMRFYGRLSVLAGALIALILIMFFSEGGTRVSVLDQFFIEMNIDSANIGVEEFVEEGPPARYLATFEFEDGRKLYVTPAGTCRVEGGEQ